MQLGVLSLDSNCVHGLVYTAGLAAITAVIYVALKFSYEAFNLYIWSRFKQETSLLSYGKWAVITGGSDGIGKALAKEIARNGLNICFVGRNEQKIESVCSEIRETCDIETKVIIADLNDTSSYNHIREEVDKIDDIGILVNCAGLSLGTKRFNDVDFKACLDLINVNVSAVVWMTRVVTPKMMAKHRGLVINIGSMTSTLTMPRIALYSASKDFMSHFTQSLEHELKPYNVRVKCLNTGYVRTNITQSDSAINSMAKTYPWAFLTPERFAKSTLACLKTGDPPREFASHFSHWLFYNLNRLAILGADNVPTRLEFVATRFLKIVKLFSPKKERHH